MWRSTERSAGEQNWLIFGAARRLVGQNLRNPTFSRSVKSYQTATTHKDTSTLREIKTSYKQYWQIKTWRSEIGHNRPLGASPLIVCAV
ncbi:hypothetical protein ILYODFUR_024339 [Ilyodon furcidens]|uniref:Uncharacterized protein n=1 Tax=Ilyodon furcidens TaxID=33524 RepID=A0ABV0T304_9TELE